MRTALLLLSILAVIYTNIALGQHLNTHSDSCRGDIADIELFVDSLLSPKEIVFSDKIVEAGQGMSWHRKWGPRLKKPLCIEFGKKKYKLKNAHIVFGFDDLRDGVYDIDTAIKFSFKGKEFYFASGGYRNCNGSGCGTRVYFLVDLKKDRLHLFQQFRPPANRFFGDINNDGQLDLLIQDYLGTRGYEERNAVVALYPYTMDNSRHFARMKGIDGVECFLVGIGDDKWYPEKFCIVGYNCLSLEIR